MNTNTLDKQNILPLVKWFKNGKKSKLRIINLIKFIISYEIGLQINQ